MCGIFGYIGPKNVTEITLEGLKKLEYRGYDSAGLAGIKDQKIYSWKEVGKVAELEKEVRKSPVNLEIAIAQTRWATHGGVTKANAHPHLDNEKTMALVHNGIIENYDIIKSQLIQEGYTFSSETDTEVIVLLISKHYQGNLLEAVQKTIPDLSGSYAFALVHSSHPDTIIAVGNGCPLLIGIGHEESFISSDYHAFAFYTREVMYLSQGEIAVVKANQFEIYNTHAKKVQRKATQIEAVSQDISKGNFEHFTLKEIFEQPRTLQNAFTNRFIEDYGIAVFEELAGPRPLFDNVQRILILGCGTSFNAGMVASYMFEELAHIPVQVEISSEFRYKHAVLSSNTLVIAISQSGETADTIAAIHELKARGAKILSICNVYGSSIAREADGCIYLRSGPEIGVCSTKAFTSQLVVLFLIALRLARMGAMPQEEGRALLKELELIPLKSQSILDQAHSIQEIAALYAQYDNFFFLGRHYMYPTALEGALKLKEISYTNANGYPAGELKHGPIALINPDCPTVALTANKATFTKLLSNLMEVKARKGPVIAISSQVDRGLAQIADHILSVPDTIDPLAPILSSIVAQLFAYYIAKERGADIDQPRNLAKSVTVE